MILMGKQFDNICVTFKRFCDMMKKNWVMEDTVIFYI